MLRVAASMRERSFRVWVDTEMMSGSTLDAMAAAVENAHCVLICITERYKASANCRLEGTYVHEQRKAWVPLMLEKSYRPTGWLGIMLGSRLYYEFTEAALAEHANWERLADSVALEVRRHGAPAPHSPAPTVVAAAPGNAVVEACSRRDNCRHDVVRARDGADAGADARAGAYARGLGREQQRRAHRPHQHGEHRKHQYKQQHQHQQLEQQQQLRQQDKHHDRDADISNFGGHCGN